MYLINVCGRSYTFTLVKYLFYILMFMLKPVVARAHSVTVNATGCGFDRGNEISI